MLTQSPDLTKRRNLPRFAKTGNRQCRKFRIKRKYYCNAPGLHDAGIPLNNATPTKQPFNDIATLTGVNHNGHAEILLGCCGVVLQLPKNQRWQSPALVLLRAALGTMLVANGNNTRAPRDCG